MSKRSSINARSKVAENRVSQYLWGSYRDWKDQHDISGPDKYGNVWYGEVKNWEWVSGPRGLWTILKKAYAQVEKATVEILKDHVGYPLIFAVFLPKHCEVEDAIVIRMNAEDVCIQTLKDFKKLVIGYEDVS